MELCKYCDGICCLNPPQLYPEEAEQIKKAGAELIGFEKQGKVFVSVKPVKNQCPFLENGKCRIYAERPKVCRQFECINMHTPLLELAKCEPAKAITGFIKPHTKPSSIDPNIAWNKKEAQRMGGTYCLNEKLQNASGIVVSQQEDWHRPG